MVESAGSETQRNEKNEKRKSSRLQLSNMSPSFCVLITGQLPASTPVLEHCCKPNKMPTMVYEKKRGKKSKTRMTASILKQDPNTQKSSKEHLFIMTSLKIVSASINKRSFEPFYVLDLI